QALQASDAETFWKNLGLPFFLVLLVLLSVMMASRLYLICLAGFVPARLRTDVARMQRVINAIYLAMAFQLIAAGWLLLRVNAKELMLGAVAIAVGAL